MQITLNHEEILKALDTYVRSQINIADDQEIIIDMKAGRGENGYSATLDIVPASKANVAGALTMAVVKQPTVTSAVNFSKPTVTFEPEGQNEVEEQSDPEVAETEDEAAPPVNPRSIFSKAKASA